MIRLSCVKQLVAVFFERIQNERWLIFMWVIRDPCQHDESSNDEREVLDMLQCNSLANCQMVE